MSFKTIAGGFNGAFWWYGPLSEDQEILKQIYQNYNVSCGFNRLLMGYKITGTKSVSVCVCVWTEGVNEGSYPSQNALNKRVGKWKGKFCKKANFPVILMTDIDTVEPRYNEVLGTMKITLLYQVSHYIRVKKQRNTKSWDQQNYLVIRGFCYIRPLYNEVPL